MATEAIAITGILIVCSVAIIIGDAAVSGILAWVSCITFKRAFLKGLLLLLLPPLVMAYGAWIGREKPQVKIVEITFGNLPESFDEVVLEGGNHAQFGMYGTQSGDGQATITPDEQIELTVELILNHIKTATN